jgi:hypothetical protein
MERKDIEEILSPQGSLPTADGKSIAHALLHKVTL